MLRKRSQRLAVASASATKVANFSDENATKTQQRKPISKLQPHSTSAKPNTIDATTSTPTLATRRPLRDRNAIPQVTALPDSKIQPQLKTKPGLKKARAKAAAAISARRSPKALAALSDLTLHPSSTRRSAKVARSGQDRMQTQTSRSRSSTSNHTSHQQQQQSVNLLHSKNAKSKSENNIEVDENESILCQAYVEIPSFPPSSAASPTRVRDFAYELPSLEPNLQLQPSHHPSQTTGDNPPALAAVADSDDLEYVNVPTAALKQTQPWTTRSQKLDLPDSSPPLYSTGHVSDSDKENQPPKSWSLPSLSQNRPLSLTPRLIAADPNLALYSPPRHSTPLASRQLASVPNMDDGEDNANHISTRPPSNLVARTGRSDPMLGDPFQPSSSEDRRQQHSRTSRIDAWKNNDPLAQGLHNPSFAKVLEWTQHQKQQMEQQQRQQEQDPLSSESMSSMVPPPSPIKETAPRRISFGEFDDPFGFLATTRKVSLQTGGETLKEEARQAQIPDESSAKNKVNENNDGPAQDDEKLAERVFASSSPVLQPTKGLARLGSPEVVIDNFTSALLNRLDDGFAVVPDSDVPEQALNNEQGALDRSVIPVIFSDSVAERLDSPKRPPSSDLDLPSKPTAVSQGAVFNSSLSSVPSSLFEKPTNTPKNAVSTGSTQAQTRTQRKKRSSTAIFQSIPLKKSEVKERQMLERLNQPSSSSGSSTQVSADTERTSRSRERKSKIETSSKPTTSKKKKRAKPPLKMDDLVLLLPHRHDSKANSSNEARQGKKGNKTKAKQISRKSGSTKKSTTKPNETAAETTYNKSDKYGKGGASRHQNGEEIIVEVLIPPSSEPGTSPPALSGIEEQVEGGTRRTIEKNEHLKTSTRGRRASKRNKTTSTSPLAPREAEEKSSDHANSSNTESHGSEMYSADDEQGRKKRGGDKQDGNLVTSTDSRSSDSDRTKRRKLYKRLEGYELEKELVI